MLAAIAIACSTINPGFASALPSTQGRTILVDIDSQRLIAYEGTKVVWTFACSTGKRNGTPRGTFPIREKRRYNRALPKFGGGQIPYSLRLDVHAKDGRRRLIAIHAYKSVPKFPASHGCVRLTYSNAAKLFSWAQVGTAVTIR